MQYIILIQVGLRTDANILVRNWFLRDPPICGIVRFCATAIYPYLAYDVINDLVAKGEILGDPIYAQTNFRKGIEKAY